MTTETLDLPPPAIMAKAPSPPARPRRRTPFLMAGMAAIALTASGGYWALNVGRETTDDAQVEGRVMNVSARVPGQLLAVHVLDNQRVSAGDVLLELDPSDFAAKQQVARADLAAAKATLEGSRAALALTEKTAPANLTQARGSMTAAASSVTSARAAIEQAKADLASAESKRALAEINLKRSKALFSGNAVPQADVDARQTEYDAANGVYEQARAHLASSEAGLLGSGGGLELAKGRLASAETYDEQLASARAALALAEARVTQAEATLRLADLDVSYATVRAPRGGVVSRRAAEVGQMVSPERPLLAIVPLEDVWIVANFKEDQLGEMHVGQHATIRLDTYSGKVLQGHVDSISGGTGARFALLPPDNATGNFVKVVQRVPVLIRLDAPAGLDLLPGMSADVTVRTSKP